MAVKPTEQAEWATTGSVTTPSAPKKALGWVGDEKPPAEYLNWWQRLAYQWIQFFDRAFSNNNATRAQGNVDFAIPLEATLVPAVKVRDWQDNARFVIDHNGFPGGQFTQLIETWRPDIIKFWPNIRHGDGTATYTGPWELNAVSETVTIPFDLPLGAVVTNVRVSTSNGSGNTLTYSLTTRKFDDGASTAFTEFTTTTAAAGFIVPYTIGADDARAYIADATVGQFALNIVLSTYVATSTLIHGFEVTYHNPPQGWVLGHGNAALSGGSGSTSKVLQKSATTSAMGKQAIKLIAAGTAGLSGLSTLQAQSDELEIRADSVIVFETELRTGTITDASDDREFFAGLNVSGAAFTELGFHSIAGTANWRLKKSGASATYTDLGVAIAANTTYRFRLEILGTAANSSGLVKLRTWIDGVATSDENVASATVTGFLKRYVICQATSAAAGPYDFELAATALKFNHLAASDNI